MDGSSNMQDKNSEQEIDSEQIKNTTTASNTIDLTESSDANEPLLKKKKGYKISSPVWEEFERILDQNGKVAWGICKYCKIRLKCPSTQRTSTLTRHLKLCKYNTNKRAKGQRLLSFQTVTDDGGMVMSNWKFDQEACKRAMARMIILDELSFKFVEKEGFREFCKGVQPLIRHVSRTTIVKEIFKIYMLEKAKLQKIFSEDVRRVCLTTDLWTSNQNIGYLCLTAHFIDSNWTLQKRILNFCILPSPHTGEAIANAIEQYLNDWNIGQVCTLTVDNASANDVALNTLRLNLKMKNALFGDGESLHVRCVAHILNLVVKEGTEQIKDSIARIRNSIKWVKSSPSRKQTFGKSCESVRILSKMSLCLDVPTRWNSTYLMLKHALPFEMAFKHLEVNDASFRSSSTPLEEDWNHARVLCDFLVLFFDATEILSGTKYVTSSYHFPQLDAIQDRLKSFSAENDNPILLHMCNKMKKKLAKYWGSIDKFNIYLLIAVVFDPRYKLGYLEFCLSIFLPADQVSALSKKVYDKMVELYGTYKSGSTSSTTSSLSEASGAPSESKNSKWKLWQSMNSSNVGVITNEIDAYLKDPVENEVEPFDILAWWSTATKYKILSFMAKDILAIPVSTVASESAFSTGGRVLDQYRSSLTPMLVECLICSQDWLKASPVDSNYEEFVDQLDKCVRDEVSQTSGNAASGSLPPILPRN